MMKWFATILLCTMFIAGQNRFIQKDDYSTSLRKLAFKTSKHPEERNANIYFGKGKVSKRWFRGNMISYEREEFTDLKMRYNIFNETLEINYGDSYYFVGKLRLKGFTLWVKDQVHHFQNGYILNEDFNVTISVKGSGNIDQSINQITKILTDNLEGSIEEISLKNEGPAFDGKIKVRVDDSYKLNLFISMLYKVEGMDEVSLISNAPAYLNFDLMEVLNQGSYKLLKKYSSKQLNGRPNVLTNDEYVSFTHNVQYFFCGGNSSIKPVILWKKNVIGFLKETTDPIELDRIIFQNNLNVRKEQQLVVLLEILNSL